ncbi:MAG TPA: mechanosensitive ion channel family protein [Vicinamibacterales bacterium]|nr:mechanosensitive ion channel family protein [Vicinamibacterales bacterium]
MTNLNTLAAVIVAFLIAATAARVARLLINRLEGWLDVVSADNREAIRARGRQLTTALTLLAYGIAAFASVSLLLSRLGVPEVGWDLRAFGRWLVTHGINMAVIVVGAYVVVRAADLAIEHLQFKIGRHHPQADLEWQRRTSTIGGILTSIVTVGVVFVAALMLLRELSIDVMPILTGAGIAGLAIGFGAQNLVRDVISGFFLILEDQVRVGDLARINGVTGVVEQVRLRTIVVRDGDGAVQVFPNGSITALANLSKLFAYAIVDVKVAYIENIDRVIGILRDVGTSMEGDVAWRPLLLAPLDVVGVVSLDNGMTTLRVQFKVLPLHQGKIANELRKRAVGTLVRQGVRPYA